MKDPALRKPGYNPDAQDLTFGRVAFRDPSNRDENSAIREYHQTKAYLGPAHKQYLARRHHVWHSPC